MAKICGKCGNKVPWTVTIDGRRRLLTKRKYCLDCSPFGEHNTKKLDVLGDGRFCDGCGIEFAAKQHRICPTCQYRKNWHKRREKIYSLVGLSCWICGYNKGMAGTAALDFHHMDTSIKSFNLSRREIATLSWKRIWTEMKKCALLCCRCHREVHAGILDSNEVERVYKGRWSNIPDMEETPKIRKLNAKSGSQIRRESFPCKEELQTMLWELPTTRIAEKYSVSDKAVEKWAKKFALTKPERGYWAKKHSAENVSNGGI
jgi:hypothetical protein